MAADKKLLSSWRRGLLRALTLVVLAPLWVPCVMACLLVFGLFQAIVTCVDLAAWAVYPEWEFIWLYAELRG